MSIRGDTEVKTSGSQKSLSDLDHVGLEIERLPGALTEEGVNDDDLFRFLAERLETAPVNVLTRTGALHLTGSPTLFLEVSLFERESDSYAYLITLELVQGVSLKRLRDPDRSFGAPTWRAQTVGFTQKGELSLLKDPIGATADAFVADFAATED
jgi:hypothetical protein